MLAKRLDVAFDQASRLSGGAGSLRNATIENPAVSLHDPKTWDDLFGGIESEAGIRVSHTSALTYAPVWQAVSIISGDVAIATANVYRRLPDDDREIDRGHPAQYIISTQWNTETAAYEGWRRIMAHALLWGNGYAYIQRRSRTGAPIALLNLLPDRTCPQYDDRGRLFYVTEVNGQLIPLLMEEVLHVKGLSLENGKGCDLIAKARNTIGLALAAEGFSAKFFSHGAQAGGILEIPASMQPVARKNLEEGWAKKYTGRDNWFKTVILREGAKFHQVTIDAQKSQTHELREDQVRDVARYFNLPPYKLGLSDSVSYNSAEQSQIVYVTGCLSHWLEGVRSESQIKLLTESERRDRTHFIEHNKSKLIEPDVKTLNEVLEIQRRNEVISANEWRRKINLNRRADPGGDEYINPNTRSGQASAEETQGSAEVQDTRASANHGVGVRLQNAHRALVVDAVQRVARRVGSHARSLAKEGDGPLCDWIDAKASDHHKAFEHAVRPAVDVVAVSQNDDADTLYRKALDMFFGTLVGRLDELTRPPFDGNQVHENVVQRMQEFENTIAAEIMPLIVKENV